MHLSQSQPPASQPPFDSHPPKPQMSSQQWHGERQTVSEQANVQHTSVTGQQNSLYSVPQPPIVAASQLLQTPALGPGDHPSVSLRFSTQGTTPAPASQGPFTSLTTTPQASSSTSSSHSAVHWCT